MGRCVVVINILITKNKTKQNNIGTLKNGKIFSIHGEISCAHYSLLFIIKLHFQCIFNYDIS